MDALAIMDVARIIGLRTREVFCDHGFPEGLTVEYNDFYFGFIKNINQTVAEDKID